MSTLYYLYTEMKRDGEWHCLNSKMKRADGNDWEMTTTFTSESSVFFGKTETKIHDFGRPVPFEKLSKSLLQEYQRRWQDKGASIYVIDFPVMCNCLPDEQLKEHHGYVHKDVVFQYEAGEIDDVYDTVDVAEFRHMEEDEKRLYQYYEWDDPTGWLTHFKQITDHVNWQIKEWRDLNTEYEYDALRVVMFVI